MEKPSVKRIWISDHAYGRFVLRYGVYNYSKMKRNVRNMLDNGWWLKETNVFFVLDNERLVKGKLKGNKFVVLTIHDVNKGDKMRLKILRNGFSG